MKIGSQYTFKETMPRHWEQFAKANGLTPAQMIKRLATLAKSLPVAAKSVLAQSERYKVEHSPCLEKALDTIEQRRKTTLRLINA